MKRHPFEVLSLCLAVLLLPACHGGDGGDEVTNDPDQPTAELPFTGTASFGAVADPQKGLTIEFGVAMDTASVENNLALSQGAASADLSLDPSVVVGAEKLTFHWNAANDTVTIFGPFPYCEEYVLTLGASTATAAGEARGEAQEIAFSTRENPADFDGVDCMADPMFTGEDAVGVVLGEEIVTFLGYTDPVVLSQFGKDGKHWIQSKMKSLLRLNNVTAEGHAMMAGLGGTAVQPEMLFWKGYVASAFAPATGSIPIGIDDQLSLRSIPDLNNDGLNEIGVGHDGRNATWDFPIMMDYVINGGGSIALDSTFAGLVDADVQHYQYAKGPRVQFGDFDGDGAQDLLYVFRGDLGDNLGNRWFIIYSPVVAGTLSYYVEGMPWQNYQFNDEHEVMITSTTPNLGEGVVGDINGDGIDDIVAPTFVNDPDTGMEVCSSIYLLFGVAGARADRTLDAEPVARIGCPNQAAYPRIVVADTNADGYRDLLFSDGDARKNYIILGRAAWAAQSEFADMIDVTFEGSSEFGLSMGMTLLGDVNNDGYQDLMLRATSSITGFRYDLLFLGRAYMHGARLSADAANVLFSYE